MNLIINSDDFGISRGMNYGVVDAFNANRLSSTTALVASKEIQHAAELAKQYPELNIGLHLSIDFLESFSKHPKLANEDGMLMRRDEAPLDRPLDPEIIIAEWELQYQEFLKIFGKKPTHFDSHHHAHIINKDCQTAVLQLAKKYKLPVRGMTTDAGTSVVNGDFYKETVSLDNLKSYITSTLKQEADNKEICLHNAHLDQTLIDATTYNYDRIKEHDILMSDEFEKFLTESDITLVGFKTKE